VADLVEGNDLRVHNGVAPAQQVGHPPPGS
jgi:hypothetical protein